MLKIVEKIQRPYYVSVYKLSFNRTPNFRKEAI